MVIDTRHIPSTTIDENRRIPTNTDENRRIDESTETAGRREFFEAVDSQLLELGSEFDALLHALGQGLHCSIRSVFFMDRTHLACV